MKTCLLKKLKMILLRAKTSTNKDEESMTSNFTTNVQT